MYHPLHHSLLITSGPGHLFLIDKTWRRPAPDLVREDA
jgi:hypothetical protein